LSEPPGQYYTHSLLKLLAWRLTQYRRVMLLDSDLLIRKPLIGLFALHGDKPVAGPLALVAHLTGGRWYSSALMTLAPSDSTFERMLAWYDQQIQGGKSDIFDMDVIGATHTDWGELSGDTMLLNVVCEISLLNPARLFQAARSVHYSGEKPWEGHRPDHPRLAYLYDLWWEVRKCSAEQFLELVAEWRG
jgi:hypothetical protein